MTVGGGMRTVAASTLANSACCPGWPRWGGHGTRPKVASLTPERMLSREATLGGHLRQYRVGTPPAGRHASGPRLGFKTRITPATAHIPVPLAELGRIMRRSKAVPQSARIRQRTPHIRGGPR
jgi:hypothetical protein